MKSKVRNEDGSNMNELKVVGYLKELFEDSKKKKKNLKNKLNSLKFSRKIKMLCIVISFLFNVHFVLECKC